MHLLDANEQRFALTAWAAVRPDPEPPPSWRHPP
jgi:hypothetical protein